MRPSPRHCLTRAPTCQREQQEPIARPPTSFEQSRCIARACQSRGRHEPFNSRQGRKVDSDTPLHNAIHREMVAVANALLELCVLTCFSKNPPASTRPTFAYEFDGRELYPGHVYAMRKDFIDFMKTEVLVAGCRVRIQGLIRFAQYNGTRRAAALHGRELEVGHRCARCLSPADCFCSIPPLCAFVTFCLGGA
jgi:hypothetical protein